MPIFTMPGSTSSLGGEDVSVMVSEVGNDGVQLGTEKFQVTSCCQGSVSHMDIALQTLKPQSMLVLLSQRDDIASHSFEHKPLRGPGECALQVGSHFSEA